MRQLTEILPSTSSALAKAEPAPARGPRRGPDVDMPAEIAKVFATFARCFGARWERTGNDRQAPVVWQRAFEVAGLTPAQIRFGLERSSQLAWPPTTGEFIELATFDEPSEADAFREAATWASGRKPADEAWNHPAVAAAAAKIGAHRLRLATEVEARRIFAVTYRQCIADHRAGRLPDLVPRYALPSPGQCRPVITPEQRKRVRATHIADLAKFFGAGEGAD